MASISKLPNAVALPSLEAWSKKISVAGRERLWQKAVQMFHGLSHLALQPDVVLWSSAINAYEKGNCWQGALWLLSTMALADALPNTICFNTAISACGKGLRWAWALQVLCELRSTSLAANIITYNASIDACAKSHQLEAAMALFEEMPASRVSADVVTHNSMLGAFAQGALWEQALLTFSLLKASKLQPSIVSYTVAMTACRDGAEWEQVLRLFQEMLDTRLLPNTITYNVMRSAFEKGETQIRQLKLATLDGARIQSTSGQECEQSDLLGQGLVHFCIFQGSVGGIESWSLEDGCKQNRWDALLDGLLRCLVQDGKWPNGLRASVFVGGDSIHLDSSIQDFLMPMVGRREDGRHMYKPVTLRAWEEFLWRLRGSNRIRGLRWHQPADEAKSHEEARKQLLEDLDEVIANAPENAVVLAFSANSVNGVQRVSYDHLKTLHIEPQRAGLRSRVVYLLLGGAHGFDGNGDRDGSLFLASVLQSFKKRLGSDRVVCVHLSNERPDKGTKFTLSQVASFLAVENACGGLACAVAGVDVLAAVGTIDNYIAYFLL